VFFWESPTHFSFGVIVLANFGGFLEAIDLGCGAETNSLDIEDGA
jgi:hypothetical protein